MCEYCKKRINNKKILDIDNETETHMEIINQKKSWGYMLYVEIEGQDNDGYKTSQFFQISYCPMCRKEARRVKVLKKGKYQKENIITCEKCSCEFQYYDTEIIVDMTTPDEESFLGGFGVHKYLKCPTCNAICTISTDFIEHKSIFTEIKEWWKNLFYASTSKEDK